MKIFAVIPAFNEGKRIGEVLEELRKTQFPVILVDDGSADNTYEKASKGKSLNERLFVLKHEVNLGKGAAMKTGAEAAFALGADAVVFLDGDGQHAVADIPKFVAKLKNHEVVLGEREISGDVSIRIYGSRVISRVANILYGVNVQDFLCGFRAITRKAYGKIKWSSTDYGVETEMIARVGKNNISYAVVPVKSIYHDIYKGFSVMDGLKLLYNIVSWKFTI